jgi:hypothetical protein
MLGLKARPAGLGFARSALRAFYSNNALAQTVSSATLGINAGKQQVEGGAMVGHSAGRTSSSICATRASIIEQAAAPGEAVPASNACVTLNCGAASRIRKRGGYFSLCEVAREARCDDPGAGYGCSPQT